MLVFSPPGTSSSIATFVATEGESPLAIPQGEFIEAYKIHGAVLLRSFDLKLETFAELTQVHCTGSVFNESPGRGMLDSAANVQTVNAGNDPFPLHPELSREPWQPDICFFWCIRHPEVGGETTFCDGQEIARNLPEVTRNAFSGRRLRYTQPASKDACLRWLGVVDPSDEDLAVPRLNSPYQFFRRSGRVFRTFTRPALHVPMFSTEPAFANFLIFARRYNGMANFPTFENGATIPEELVKSVEAVCEPLTLALNWCAGDVLVLNNTRFMHGRREIVEPHNRLIATYFGYLRCAEPSIDEIPSAPWRSVGFRPPSQGPN